MAELRDLDVEYVIAGQTHPKVLEHEGERYRDHLRAVIAELDLDARVTLDDRYLDSRQLDALVSTADVVVLPYESREQATSGVLAEAVGAGIPVVATRFPHSVELLRDGAGIIVDHADPSAIADAVRTILARHRAGALREAHAADSRLSAWPVVAESYRRLAETISAVRAA
jgi:glycosyltransferase involved in cell wall biosynthesis